MMRTEYPLDKQTAQHRDGVFDALKVKTDRSYSFILLIDYLVYHKDFKMINEFHKAMSMTVALSIIVAIIYLIFASIFGNDLAVTITLVLILLVGLFLAVLMTMFWIRYFQERKKQKEENRLNDS